MSENGDGTFKFENVLQLPLLVSAFALTFDAGYFYGLDINFFTLFSLAEHLVFSLEALPLALALSIGIVVTPVTINLTRLLEQVRVKRKEQGRKDRPFYKKFLFYFTIIYFLFLIWFAVHTKLVSAIYGVVALLLSMVGALFLALEKLRTWVFAAYIFLVLEGFVGALGFDIARGYRNGKTYEHALTTSNGEQLIIKLVRSGERGVLIIESPFAKISFLKWDEVKKIGTR